MFLTTFVQIVELIGCRGDMKGQFSKTYSKLLLSETTRGMKLKLGIHACGVSCSIACVLLSMSNCFRCYVTLKFP